MNAMSGKLVWVEHASADPGKARAFYEPLFGWTSSAMEVAGSNYQVISNAGEGIGGYRPTQEGEPSNWGIYLSVADVDKSYAQALLAGAQPWMPPTDFAPVGRGATLLDPVGATVSIWRSAGEDRADADVPPGHWCWHELQASDPLKALAFYEGLFGLSHDDVPMSDGAYYVMKNGDNRRGGIMKSFSPDAASMWLPYVHVADVDASTAKAKSLGADICVPPTDIPGIGRFSVLRDPQGASLAVFLPLGR